MGSWEKAHFLRPDQGLAEDSAPVRGSGLVPRTQSRLDSQQLRLLSLRVGGVGVQDRPSPERAVSLNQMAQWSYPHLPIHTTIPLCG